MFRKRVVGFLYVAVFFGFVAFSFAVSWLYPGRDCEGDWDRSGYHVCR